MFDFALIDFAKANCKEQPTEWWFPEYPPTSTNAGNTRKAKQICSTCHIKHECLAYGQSTLSYGIWGGFTLTAGNIGRKSNKQKMEKTK